MKKISFFVSVALVFAAILFVGCNKKREAKNTLLFAKIASGHSINPLFELGRQYYNEYGLDVNIVLLQREAIFEAEGFGKVDGAFNDLFFPLNYGGDGGNLVIYGGAMNGGMALFANSKSAESNPDIKNPANWKGLKVVVMPFSIAEIITKTVLKKAGLDPEKDVKYIVIEGQPEGLSAVQKGTADIVITGPDFVETGKQMGLTYLFPLTALENEYVCCRQTANADKIKAEPELFVSLLKAHIRAFKDYKSGNQEEQIKIMAKSSGGEPEWIYDYLYNLEKTQGRSHNPDPCYNKSLVVYETIGKERPLPEFFNIDLYAKALQEVIKQFPDEKFYRDMWTFFVENNNQYPNFSRDYSQNL